MFLRWSASIGRGVIFSILTLPVYLTSPEFTYSQDIQTLDPVVVSATKTPIPLSHVTSAVEVFTESDFEQRKIKTVLEALRLSQGAAVFQNGGPGGLASVRLRGASSSQTLVLIDGAIVNGATSGQFNFGNLTTDNIEKIEIVRGAQSTLWGGDAIGGVINITTKKGSGVPEVGAFLEYGSFNTLREGGHVSGQKGPFDLSMALSRLDTTSFSAVNFRRGASERDSYRNWQASSRVGVVMPFDGRVDFNFRWWSGSLNIDSATPADVVKGRNDSKQFIYSGRYEQPLTNWWSHFLTLSRSEESSLNVPGISQRNLRTGAVSVPFGSPNETRVLSNRIESQHNFHINQYSTLVVGYQFREQQGENDSGLINKIISSHSGFAQVQIQIFDRVFATAGLRQDSYNTFGDATTYRVTGGYLLKETNTKFRGSYATGFKAPTINDLFFPNFDNPTLKPEKSQSFDVGVEQDLFGKRLQIQIGYFWNRFRNLIVFQTNSACNAFNINGSCPLNVGAAKSQGWEAGFTYRVTGGRFLLKALTIQGKYTMTLTRDLITGTRLPRWPVDQAIVSVIYQPIDPVNFVLDYRFVGSQFDSPTTAQNDSEKVESFNVVNVTVSYDVAKNIQVYSRVDNLFDEEYEEIQFFGTPVRSIYGGVNVEFDFPSFSN